MTTSLVSSRQLTREGLVDGSGDRAGVSVRQRKGTQLQGRVVFLAIQLGDQGTDALPLPFWRRNNQTSRTGVGHNGDRALGRCRGRVGIRAVEDAKSFSNLFRFRPLQRHNLRDQWILNRTVKTLDDLLDVLPLVWRGPHDDSVRIAFKIEAWPRCLAGSTIGHALQGVHHVICHGMFQLHHVELAHWLGRSGGQFLEQPLNDGHRFRGRVHHHRVGSLIGHNPGADEHRFIGPFRQHRRTGGSTLRIEPQRRGQQTHRFVGPALIKAEGSKHGLVGRFGLIEQGDKLPSLSQDSLGATQGDASGARIHRDGQIITSPARKLLAKRSGHCVGVSFQHLNQLDFALTQTLGFIGNIKDVDQSRNSFKLLFTACNHQGVGPHVSANFESSLLAITVSVQGRELAVHDGENRAANTLGLSKLQAKGSH